MMSRLLFFCSVFMMPFAIVAQSVQKVVVYFPFNKYYITNEAAGVLEKTIRANAGKTIDSIKIYAWCDSIGTFAINDTLALQRAASVKRYLLLRGIGKNNFREIKGFGRRVPLNNNSSDSLRALNRRAEITIYTSEASIKDSLRAIVQFLQAGQKFGLRNLNFYGGSHRLLPYAVAIVDSLASVMKLFPQLEIEIQGYVCCVPVGQEGYDRDESKWELSVNRAKEVYNYLIGKGISARRLTYKGYGNKPLVEENDEVGRAANRRVEIKIVKK